MSSFKRCPYCRRTLHLGGYSTVHRKVSQLLRASDLERPPEVLIVNIWSAFKAVCHLNFRENFKICKTPHCPSVFLAPSSTLQNSFVLWLPWNFDDCVFYRYLKNKEACLQKENSTGQRRLSKLKLQQEACQFSQLENAHPLDNTSASLPNLHFTEL